MFSLPFVWAFNARAEEERLAGTSGASLPHSFPPPSAPAYKKVTSHTATTGSSSVRIAQGMQLWIEETGCFGQRCYN